MRPPLVSNHQNFPSQSLTVGTSSKRPPPVSDRDHFLVLMVNDCPLFLTFCKRPLDVFSNLYVCCGCVHDATKDIRRTLVTTWNYTLHEIYIFHKLDVSGPRASHETKRQKLAKNWLQKCLSCVEARDETLRKGKAVATFISAVKHRKDRVYKRLSEEL